jgi:hypothetical protein
MKFTVPAAKDRNQAEDVWRAVRDFLAQQGFQTHPDRFARITFKHNSKTYDLSVGDIHPDLHEPVCVILKATTHFIYYVCTTNRGVVRGDPYLVGDGPETRAYGFDSD